MKQYITSALLLLSLAGFSQSPAGKEAAYLRVVTSRAEKIVKEMNITDTAKFRAATELIAHQYNNLNNIYIRRDEATQQLKAGTTDKALLEKGAQEIYNTTKASVDSLHAIYISKLFLELTPQQVEQVKNGMTYGVLPITWAGYMDMLPRLTAEQKAQMYAWLMEARENAMDGESSERKHAWFGKFKGRINNYLSQQGYDMKKESKEWEERVRQRKAQGSGK